jgi:hypothetical protein
MAETNANTGGEEEPWMCAGMRNAKWATQRECKHGIKQAKGVFVRRIHIPARICAFFSARATSEITV